MARAALANKWDTAREIFRKYLPLMQANFIESNPGPVKAVLAMMGRIEEVYRLPLVPMKKETRAKLEKVVSELGLLERQRRVRWFEHGLRSDVSDPHLRRYRPCSAASKNRSLSRSGFVTTNHDGIFPVAGFQAAESSAMRRDHAPIQARVLAAPYAAPRTFPNSAATCRGIDRSTPPRQSPFPARHPR